MWRDVLYGATVAIRLMVAPWIVAFALISEYRWLG